MRVVRFFIPNFSAARKEATIADASTVHQIRNVLRLKIGAQFVVFDGEGTETRLKLVGNKSNAVKAAVEETRKKRIQAKNRIVLYAAMLKKDNFEWALQKATEAGAESIVPLITERTIKLNLNEERMEKILRRRRSSRADRFCPPLQNQLFLPMS